MCNGRTTFLISALSLKVMEISFTPSTERIFLRKLSSAVKYLPLEAVTFKSGSKALYRSATVDVKPFIAERITMSAPVVTAMAPTLIQLIMLIALLDFFETKYRLAM
jgi:hypothetical protein